MTQHKHLKHLVRARMQKTGESYAAARRQVVQQAVPAPFRPSGPRHFPGVVPAAAGCGCSSLTPASWRLTPGSPSAKPWSSALRAVSARECSRSLREGGFFELLRRRPASLAGRGRLYEETPASGWGWCPFSRNRAVRRSRKSICWRRSARGPVLAWVDMVHLPHRGVPKAYSGMMYYLVTVYDADPSDGSASIGDAADEPIEVPLSALRRGTGAHQVAEAPHPESER